MLIVFLYHHQKGQLCPMHSWLFNMFWIAWIWYKILNFHFRFLSSTVYSDKMGFYLWFVKHPQAHIFMTVLLEFLWSEANTFTNLPTSPFTTRRGSSGPNPNPPQSGLKLVIHSQRTFFSFDNPAFLLKRGCIHHRSLDQQWLLPSDVYSPQSPNRSSLL